MAQPTLQHSFHAGEWAPQLNARVDLQKYHSAAALMRNFYVDYRGGASTRPGTKYVLQAYKSSTNVRLIKFAASSTTQYVLEFGAYYLRFHFDGAPILESATTITGATQATPCVIHDVAHGYATGDWVFITGVTGMTQLNDKYFSITRTDADHYSLQSILDGSDINSTAYTAYSAGGTAQRVYTITTPYADTDLALLKFAQSVNVMILCHTTYPAYALTLIAATNWTLAPIVYGSALTAPVQAGLATSAGGTGNLSYLLTAVDSNGQESAISNIQSTTINTAGSTVTVTWTAVAGAQFYNIYRTAVNLVGAPATGAAFGFVGSAGAGATSMYDTFGAGFVSQVAVDFGVGPPVVQNPFKGGAVSSITITLAGTYTSADAFPTVTIAPPSSGTTATASAVLMTKNDSLNNGGSGYIVGDVVSDVAGSGFTIQVFSAPGGNINGYTLVSPGTKTSGTIPDTITVSSRASNAIFNVQWKVTSAPLFSGGSGYSSSSLPAVTFGASTTTTATGAAVVDSVNVGNPGVPQFYQQRLVLAAPVAAPQTFYMSQPGAPYNFNTSDPIQDDDSITGSIISQTLNTIKSMIPMASGLIVLADAAAWLVNGGSQGAVVTPADATANTQAYNGASDVPPLVVNYDVLYVQAKGAIVRDLAYNFYTNIYTGTDISVLSSHLFFGYSINEWAYAEEPFKVVWAIRNDGELLSLTFLKEQDLVGWAHHDTEGDFKSVTTVVETVTTPDGFAVQVDAAYVVVARTINGNSVKYIERIADRFFGVSPDVKWAWCVDAALQYNSTPATVFSGLDHLVGAIVTGLADGVVVPPTVVSASGSVTLAAPASVVTLGLAFTPQLQTLRLAVEDKPTDQGKRKSVPAVTVRVQDTLGLSIGRSFSSLVPMKDLVVGNVGTMSNTVVTGLVTDDARTIIDPLWDVPGEYCIEQSSPLPATVLGVIPEIAIGDTGK